MVKDDNEQDYQDPLLIPGNIRKIVQNLPAKTKHNIDYDYHGDTSILENELNEFFDYREVEVQLKEYKQSYEKEYHNNQLKDIIASLLDSLENTDQNRRIHACKHLVYLITAELSKEEETASLLLSYVVFSAVYQKLQMSIKHYYTIKENDETCIEIDLYLTIIYVLLETQRQQQSQKFKNELTSCNPNLTEVLLIAIAKTREKVAQFPIKKALLVLWKSVLFMSGGLDAIKKSTGLDDKNIVTKCTPEDYILFQNETFQKYPGFCPANKYPIDITSPLTLTNSHSLTKAMGFSKAVENTELFYQTLFPPKSTSKNYHNNNSHLFQEYYPGRENAVLLLPLQNHPGLNVPKSIQEADDIFISNMYVSLSARQIIQEKSKAIHRWQSFPQTIEKSASLIDTIYANILPHLQSFIVVILKQLLTTVTPNPQQLEQDEPITLEYLEHADTLRNKEILSKAISGLLLVLLKWAKSSHVLKFEYISQLLVDSGCLLLVLKMIGLQDIFELVKAQTDVSGYGLFPHTNSLENKRNMYWSINLLRILQLLTKHKPHRTMMMVQYKSAAILKRVLKVQHPLLEHYALKLLKNQVPYLGRKWRTHNMKIVSSIYLHCKTMLKDDWMSKVESGDDEENGKMQERVLRILTQIYHHDQYGLSLPIHDELAVVLDDESPLGPGYHGWINYDLHEKEDLITENPLYDYDVTPIPSMKTFTAKELDKALSKLYMDELNSEFGAKLSPFDAEENHLPSSKKPLTPLPRYNGGEKMTYSSPKEQENDIFARLLQIEEKVIEKWYSTTTTEPTYKMFEC